MFVGEERMARQINARQINGNQNGNREKNPYM